MVRMRGRGNGGREDVKQRPSNDLTPEQWTRIHRIADEAASRPPIEQEAFIRRRAAGDARIVEEAISLVSGTDLGDEGKSDESNAPTLEGASHPGDPASSSSSPSGPGPREGARLERIGHYRILRVIASGGMGTVFQAEQDWPRRVVAVKVMRSGLFSSSAQKRFEYEAQILARLRHPGIAQIYEAGVHRDHDADPGVPYFAMEYLVNARPVTDYAVAHDLDLRARIELFLPVCDAVHHGHQKGIIHRDLKPANILVDGTGLPKIIDFGVARATDADLSVPTLQTDVGQLVGTLQYMSPEQCEADPHDLDTRSDVYSLGVVLYELVCGRLPYDITKTPALEATRIIREKAPTRLSAVSTALRGDLETIVLKALEKDRQRRYQTAPDLAADLRAFLERRPISARPTSLAYKARLFARRNKVFVGAAAIVAATLLAGVVGISWALVTANQARHDMETQAQRARETSGFLTDLLSLPNPYVYKGGPDVKVVELLDEASRRIDDQFEADPVLRAELRQTLGVTYRNVGRYDDSERELRQAAALFGETLGPGDPRSLKAKAVLGGLLCDLEEFDESESLLRAALSGLTTSEGERHPDTLFALNSLGWTLFNAGRSADALPLFERALEIREDVLGIDSPETLKTMTNLAVARIDLGRLDEAEEPARVASERLRALHGAAHPDAIYATHIRAWWLWRSGDKEESRALYDDVLANANLTFGPRHPHTLYWRTNLADLLRSMGLFDEAAREAAEILAIAEADLGPANPRTLLTRELITLIEQDRDSIDGEPEDPMDDD